jgi:hypothetical protein
MDFPELSEWLLKRKQGKHENGKGYMHIHYKFNSMTGCVGSYGAYNI